MCFRSSNAGLSQRERRKLGGERQEAGGEEGKKEKQGRGRGEDWTWRKAGRSTERDERERMGGGQKEHGTSVRPRHPQVLLSMRASWFHLLNTIISPSCCLKTHTQLSVINPRKAVPEHECGERSDSKTFSNVNISRGLAGVKSRRKKEEKQRPGETCITNLQPLGHSPR